MQRGLPLRPTYEEAEIISLPSDTSVRQRGPRLSAADAQAALRQLVEDSHNDVGIQDVDTSLTSVVGFKEGIELFPHQVVARKCMKARESGKATGGILADDMG